MTDLLIESDEDQKMHSQCSILLGQFQDDELMLAVILLNPSFPKSIPTSREALIQRCLDTRPTFRTDTKLELLVDIKDKIDRYAHREEEFNWVPTPMPKRLEALLRDQIGDNWIEVGKLSNKKQFILMYNIFAIKDDNLPSLDDLNSHWHLLKSLNELTFINKKNAPSFLEVFRDIYEKHLQERQRYPTYRNTLLRTLETTEDALIWLDDFSSNPDDRKLLVDRIKKSWRQKEYREKSGRVQKNFMLPKDIADALKTLAEENGLNETEVISLLIHQERKNSTHIKSFLNRKAAIEQALAE